jgi:hypothetical protein
MTYAIFTLRLIAIIRSFGTCAGRSFLRKGALRLPLFIAPSTSSSSHLLHSHF